MRRASLRLRLFVLILTPLTLMAVLLGYWRFSVAQQTAEDLFDKSLLSAALAISRDVLIYDGDAILPSTRELIRDASGGEVFYHATGPGGIYVTGYAYPPIDRTDQQKRLDVPRIFQSSYRGEPVRVLQITERVPVGNIWGNATVTVWQNLTDRRAFARFLAMQTAALMGVLLVTLAFVVWFGVKLGLRPLTDLQDAIAIRSPDDLSRIKRAVPVETKGIVQTLNRLFVQVERSIDAQQAFISDAAHQLRNPSAAVLSMAEAARDAVQDCDRKKRLNELVDAARNSTRIAEQLLSLERLRNSLGSQSQVPLELVSLVRRTCEDIAPVVFSRGVDFGVELPSERADIVGDPVFLSEALKNLIDNALQHGGPQLSSISVAMKLLDNSIELTVRDDGKGLAPEDSRTAFSRFSQVEPSEGSGLGLAIAVSVAKHHEGHLQIDRVEVGASLTLSLPLKSS